MPWLSWLFSARTRTAMPGGSINAGAKQKYRGAAACASKLWRLAAP